MSTRYDINKHGPLKWVVVSDHPYYPDAEYFDSEELAQAAAEKEREFMETEDGENICVITVAEVKTMRVVKSTH